MKPKILCVNLGKGGGCVYYANHLIEELPGEKEVWLNPKSEEVYTPKHKTVKWSNLRLRYLFLPTIFTMFFYTIKLYWKIKIGEYDKVIVFGPHIWDFLFLFPFRLNGKKAIYVVHDGLMHTGDAPKAYQIEIKWSLKIANKLIFLSEYTRNLVVDVFDINKDYEIIPHGIVTYGKVSSEIKRLPNHPHLLLIGRITYYKGIDLLFNYIKECDIEKVGSITIAGKFSTDIIIPQIIAKHPKVSIVNKWLSQEEIDSIINTADFILMPYHEATQSGIAAISIGYHKPTIVSRVGALEEQFGESAYYMDEISVLSLMKTIETAMGSDELYREKQIDLLELSKKLDWNVLAQKLRRFVDAK